MLTLIQDGGTSDRYAYYRIFAFVTSSSASRTSFSFFALLAFVIAAS